jgi:putative restriction endonuclease
MRFYVAITDFEWFSFLSAQKPDEVNFWQPSAHGFKRLQPGEPLLFKLHSPRNYIVGGGFFSHYAELPLRFAWDAFSEKNGARSLQEMRARVWKYRAGKPVEGNEEVIGCIML